MYLEQEERLCNYLLVDWDITFLYLCSSNVGYEPYTSSEMSSNLQTFYSHNICVCLFYLLGLRLRLFSTYLAKLLHSLYR